MKSLPLLIVTATLALPVLAAEQAEPARERVMPAELIGVWSNSDSDGRTQCAAYRKDPVPQRGHDPLAGLVLISPTMIQTRAKTGPDEYYKPDWISQVAPTTWLVRSNYYSGMFPSDGDGREPAAYMADTMMLKGKTLVWTGPETRTRKLFRCSDLVE